jgi:hypothetical protein
MCSKQKLNDTDENKQKLDDTNDTDENKQNYPNHGYLHGAQVGVKTFEKVPYVVHEESRFPKERKPCSDGKVILKSYTRLCIGCETENRALKYVLQQANTKYAILCEMTKEQVADVFKQPNKNYNMVDWLGMCLFKYNHLTTGDIDERNIALINLHHAIAYNHQFLLGNLEIENDNTTEYPRL